MRGATTPLNLHNRRMERSDWLMQTFQHYKQLNLTEEDRYVEGDRCALKEFLTLPCQSIVWI